MPKPNSLKQSLRPLRRQLMPRDFKEHYINLGLRTRGSDSTYLEIGVRWGESLRAVHAGTKIGVDPFRHAALKVLQPTEVFYEMTSDEFFSEVAPKVLRPKSLHVALVDGHHEFAQALRDVMNLEPYMAEESLIVMDDCNPQKAESAADSNRGGKWNGDVWKVIAFIRREIPGIDALTLDRDQGVGLLWNFGSDGTVRTFSPELLASYKQLTFEELVQNRESLLGLTKMRSKSLRKMGLPI